LDGGDEVAFTITRSLNIIDGACEELSLRKHADAYLEMRGPQNENGDYMISDGDLQEAWKAYAEPLGLPIDKPKLHDERYFYVVGFVVFGSLFTGDRKVDSIAGRKVIDQRRKGDRA